MKEELKCKKEAEFLAELSHGAKGKTYLITPWETSQIIQNLEDISISELEGFLSRNGDILAEIHINNGEHAVRLQTKADLADCHINEEPPIAVNAEIRIKDAFGLLLYKKIVSLSKDGSNWVYPVDLYLPALYIIAIHKAPIQINDRIREICRSTNTTIRTY